MADIPLQFGDFGNALASGAHARYYTNKARLEQNAFEGEQAARPDIAAAVGGDRAAQGRVAQASPTTFSHIAPRIAQLDADKRAQVKASAEATALAANVFLQTAPNERAAIYPQILENLKAQGHDVSNMPSMMTEAQARAYRGLSLDILKYEQQNQFEQGRMTRHFTHGGGTAGGEILEGAPAAAPGPRAAVGPMPGAPVTNVAQAPSAPMAAPPVQMAQGGQPGPAMPAGGPPMAQGDTPQTSPGMPPPVAQPVGPIATPPQAAPTVPPGWIPMGHRDASGKLVPTVINDQPVYHNPKLGEALPLDKLLAQGTPSAVPGASPVGPVPTAQPVGPSIPELKNGQLVYEDPALQGGRRVLRSMPNGTTAPIEGVGQSHKYRLPNGTEVFFNPHLKRPIDANGVPSEMGDVYGDEFRATPFYKGLSFTDRNNVEGLVDGSIPISTLAKRSGSGQGGVGGLPLNTLLGIAKQVGGKEWSPNEGEQGKRFAASLIGNGQNAQNVTAANVVPAHAADLVRLTDAMGQNNPKMIQELINKVKEQTGNPEIVSMDAARFVTAMELVKAAMGPGALNVEVEKEARRLIAGGNTAGQMRAAVSEWTDKVASRAHYLQDLADTYHLREPIMRSDAKKAMEYLKAAPGTEARGNYPAVPPSQPSVGEKVMGFFGGSSSPAAPAGGASVPTMTPEQVRAAKPGTKYRTIDGREGTRP